MKRYTNETGSQKYIQVQIPNHPMVTIPVGPHKVHDLTDDQHKYVVSSTAGFNIQHLDDGHADTIDEIIHILQTTGLNITGMRGAQGETGVQGIQGLRGQTGIQGIQGHTGPIGETGITGSKGETGLTGEQGVRGHTGIQGVRGHTGLNGLNGAKGDTGVRGETGIQGLQGLQGETGVRGITGVQGYTGPVGQTGIQGIQGNTGIIGATGLMGPQGIQGNTGVRGTTGFGVQGDTGVQGIQGNTGAQGSTGIAGTTDHNALVNLATGDAHPQYFRTDGSRIAGGDFDMGGYTLKNTGTLPGTTTAQPVGIAPDEANAEGISTHKARADHKHNIPTAAPQGSLGADSTNTQGNASTFARSNHTHAISTGAPTQIQASDSNSAGTANALAKADHVHGIATAAPTNDLSSTTTNSAGASASLARADHGHKIKTGDPVTLIPAQSNSAGSSENLAKADHVHNIPVGNVSTVGTSNSAGTGDAFARNDHVHAHGNQTDPGLHAVATTTANGFMSSLDKTKLNYLSTAFMQYYNSSVLTNSTSDYVDVYLDGNNNSNSEGLIAKPDGNSFVTNFNGYAKIDYSVYAWPSVDNRSGSFRVVKNGIPVIGSTRTVTGMNDIGRGNTAAWSGIIPVAEGDIIKLQFNSVDNSTVITLNIDAASMVVAAYRVN